jgi:hypothetical protein
MLERTTLGCQVGARAGHEHRVDADRIRAPQQRTDVARLLQTGDDQVEAVLWPR